MQDIVLFSVPYIEPTAPSAGPALLKGYLVTQGFAVTAYDWNVEFKKHINDPTLYGEFIAYWTGGNKTAMSKHSLKRYHDFLEDYAKKFAEIKTRWLGFGVFSDHSRQCLFDLLTHLKQQDLGTTRIVVGGHGLDVVYLDSISHLIDAYILGEGEIALRELLRENFSYPGINSASVQIDDLDQLGYADYSDYDLTNGYDLWYDSPMIQITGSRGCVRSCSFCEVPSIWKKYRYRSGTSLANEIITNHEKTGIRHFYFTDSLINGNVKQLMEMMSILTKYKQDTGSDLTWGGQWISRPQKGLPKDYYKLIKSSGGFNLSIGVETGSDAVREHMKKGFTNQDLDLEMEQFSRHGIRCGFFILLGYPTETEKDFKDTLRMFKRYTKYVADGTLIGVAIGNGYFAGAKTPIILEGQEVKYLDNNNSVKWVSTTTNSNFMENIRRRLIAQKVLNSLKWPSSNIEYELRGVISNSNLYFDKQDKPLVEELIRNKNLEPDQEFLAEIEPHAYEISVTLLGVAGETDPVVDIQINNVKYQNLLVQGLQTFTFKVDQARKRNLVKIALVNKTNLDTVLQHGQIVKDKHVKIENLTIHGSRFAQPFLLMQGKVKTKAAGWQAYRDGLYVQDDCYSLYFENPVHPYFIKKNKYYFETRNQFAKDMLQKVTNLFHDFVN